MSELIEERKSFHIVRFQSICETLSCRNPKVRCVSFFVGLHLIPERLGSWSSWFMVDCIVVGYELIEGENYGIHVSC